MGMNRWWSYVERVLDGMSAVEAGKKAGFDSSAFSRWKRGSRPDVLFVVQFARAFKRPVIEALAEAEFITDAEASLREVPAGVQDLDDGALIEELSRRLTRNRASAQGSTAD